MEQVADSISRLFELQRTYKLEQKNTTAAYRIDKIDEFRKAMLKRKKEIESALNSDFGKAPAETNLTEVLPIISMINLYKKNLKTWMKPRKVDSPLLFMGAHSYVSFEGKGNVLVISPWNYPFQLAIYPILSAFAAGNTVICKPSEFTPATNKVIFDLVRDVFKSEEVAIVEGEIKETHELLSKPFDHIFFTGSTPVGKIIMEKASQHLASVSLELGGKSPVVIDSTFDMAEAGKKIMWGKLVNGGQTCVAPDYAIISTEKKTEFIDSLKAAFVKSYKTEEVTKNNDYCQIITSRHAQRLKDLIDKAVAKGAVIEMGGAIYPEERTITPTILSNVSLDMEIMQEEIFGPVLPVLTLDNNEEIFKTISDLENPLALYVFSKNKNFIEEVRKNTNSGGFSVNDTLVHVAHPSLPFGGAGKSGIGKYHGHFGFEELSNLRSVLHRKKEWGTSYFYPPYTSIKRTIINILLKRFSRWL